MAAARRVARTSLRGFGRLMRGRKPMAKQDTECVPTGGKKQGRPRRSWNGGIRGAVDSRQLEENVIFNREGCGRGWRVPNFVT